MGVVWLVRLVIRRIQSRIVHNRNVQSMYICSLFAASGFTYKIAFNIQKAGHHHKP